MSTEESAASDQHPASSDLSGGASSDCDLVMKGGITSGIIYPRLISELSSRYHFRNIGGTSAGAIAAGACAAAEFRRSLGGGGDEGFKRLAALPDELSKHDSKSGRTRLFALFQPTPALRQHFLVLQRALNSRPREAIVAIASGMLRMEWKIAAIGIFFSGTILAPYLVGIGAGISYRYAVLLGVACLLSVVLALAVTANMLARNWRPGFIWLAGLVVFAPPAIVCAVWSRELGSIQVFCFLGTSVACILLLSTLLLVLFIKFVTGLLRGIHANGYGICSGKTPTDCSHATTPALTDWLADYIDEIAGLKDQGRPLTFADLWGSRDPLGMRRINLQVITSAISQQMVYSIPFRPGTPPLYYDPDEWKELFPRSIMEWLAKTGECRAMADPRTEPDKVEVRNSAGRCLNQLPSDPDLPVVVALRLSLSFPVLLSAIPLYAVDMSRKENQLASHDAASTLDSEKQWLTATRVWFSDGGIGSNLPLHMFDTLLPSRPTFAVNLKSEHPDFPICEPEEAKNQAGRIYLPETNNAGRLRYWPEPSDGTAGRGLIGFVLSIVKTMQTWRDEIQFPYPGFRDRIVQISQRSTEGGLNLDMPKDRIDALANAGTMAAQRLIDRFHTNGKQAGIGWTAHQETRLRTFLGITQPALAGLSDTLEDGPWHTHANTVYGTDSNCSRLADRFIDGLTALGQLQEGCDSLEDGALKPLAEIRISPRI